jgi:dynein heavy chain 1
LDLTYIKNLESAVRFGNSMLLTDAELCGPLLNPILGREGLRSGPGGRALVRVGDVDVDFSPTFRLFLFSSDVGSRPSADLASRVTVVNFSATPPSLAAVCLEQILATEYPDVASKRADVLRACGEQDARLAALEERLLDQLAGDMSDSSDDMSEGASASLLDDDRVLVQLEALKSEALGIQRDQASAREVLRHVGDISTRFSRLADGVSRLFFFMEALATTCPLYHFSISQFMATFEKALQACQQDRSITRDDPNLPLLLGLGIFRALASLPGKLLYEKDGLAWLPRCAAVFVESVGDSGTVAETALVLPALEALAAGASDGGTASRVQQFVASMRDAAWARDVGASIANAPEKSLWHSFVASQGPLPSLPGAVVADENGADQHLQTGQWCASVLSRLRRCATVAVFRQDLLKSELLGFVCAALRFPLGAASVGTVCGRPDSPDSLKTFVLGSAEPRGGPVSLFLCTPGSDADTHLSQAAASAGATLKSISLGALQSEVLADQALATLQNSMQNGATAGGVWLLLRNVHLASSWLTTLIKRLQSAETSGRGSALPAHVRLILTAEVPSCPLTKDGSLPDGIIKKLASLVPQPALLYCSKLLLESPTGLRASVSRLVRVAMPESSHDNSSQGATGRGLPSGNPWRPRLVLLLAWLHSVALERLRYVPRGWSKHYEVADSDFGAAVTVLDRLLSSAPLQSLARLLDALRPLASAIAYSGRLESAEDLALLEQLTDHIMAEKAMGSGYNISLQSLLPGASTESEPIHTPDADCDILQWVRALPGRLPPTVLGLPADSDTVLESEAGLATLRLEHAWRIRGPESRAADDTTLRSDSDDAGMSD